MNDHPPHANHRDDLPDELHDIAGALNQLAAADQAAAGPAFEQRLAASTLPGTNHLEMEVLASVERDAAPSTLEDRIFMATRGLLVRPAEVEAKPAVAARIHVRSWRSVARVAAMLVLVGGAGMLYMATRPGKVIAPTPIPDRAAEIARLEKSLERNFDGLAQILEVALPEENETASTTSSDSTDFELPRFDLLTVESEGSI